jgi:hypothetical protein
VPGVLRELWTQELANKLPEFDSDKDGVLSDSELLGFLRSLGVFKDACLDEIAEEIAEQAEDLDPDYVTEDGVTTDGLLQCYVQDSIKDAEDVRGILKALNLVETVPERQYETPMLGMYSKLERKCCY